jgi:glucosamine 6-phosphate synthetase-like amidotransferase/phosphosugar isomerase protein
MTICGIFGAVAQPGKKINLGIVAALAWANRERGTDSLGYFDSSGRMTKRATDPATAMRDEKLQKWLKNSQDSAWFIAGHTRFATRGSVNRRNSHPFRYGRIIGSHNGMVGAPGKFKVDSEFLVGMTVITSISCAIAGSLP